MCDALASWHANSLGLLKSMDEKLGSYKSQCEEHRVANAELEARIEAAKINVRTDPAGVEEIDEAAFGDDDVVVKASARSRSNKGKRTTIVGGPRK